MMGVFFGRSYYSYSSFLIRMLVIFYATCALTDKNLRPNNIQNMLGNITVSYTMTQDPIQIKNHQWLLIHLVMKTFIAFP